MSEENLKQVRRGYDAYARRDYPAVFETLHPEIEIHQTPQLPWGGSYRGQAEVGEFFRKLNQHIESVVEPREFVCADDRVVALGRIRGTVRSNGLPFDLAIVHVWTVRDGRLSRFEAYIDTPGMLRALSGNP